MRTAFLIAACLLAGCLEGDSPTEPEAPAIWTPEPIDETWGLAQNGSLIDGLGAGGFPLAWSWTEWLTGVMPPQWEGAARDEAFVITSANATLTYAPGLPVLPSTQNRPQFTMWFGAGDSLIEHGFQAGPDLWTDAQTVTFPIDSLPLGGLVVPANTPLVLHVGVYYPGVGELGSGNLMLAESSLEIQGHTVQLPTGGNATTTAADMELQGGRCVADLNQLGTAMGSMTFEVPAGATQVDAYLERTGTLGGPDLDFFLTDAAGEIVAYAAGPSTPEALHVYGPNLALATPGTWTATAYNCQPQLSAVTLSVTVTA